LRKFAIVTGSLGAVLSRCRAVVAAVERPIELDIARRGCPPRSSRTSQRSRRRNRRHADRARRRGRTSLRIRDIVVRDADGTVVASAPKAEVGLSGWAC